MEEVKAMHEAQANLPADHPMRVFGEYVDERSASRAKSITRYHEQVSSMSANPATHARPIYKGTNALVSRAALGKYPKEFKKELGIKNTISSCNYMSSEQLDLVALFRGLAKKEASKAHDPNNYMKEIERISDKLYSVGEELGLHGYHGLPSLPKPLKIEEEVDSSQRAITDFFGHTQP